MILLAFLKSRKCQPFDVFISLRLLENICVLNCCPSQCENLSKESRFYRGRILLPLKVDGSRLASVKLFNFGTIRWSKGKLN